VLEVIEPIFEHQFEARSYGFRPGRSCKDALREVDHWLQAGYVHVVDADLKSYFDSIDHSRLRQLLHLRIKDGSVLDLIDQFLHQQVISESGCWQPEEGTPQGAVLSPLLANVYLHPLDQQMRESGHVMVRYADDFVVLCRDADTAHAALAQIQAWVDRAKLTLHPDKTRIADLPWLSFRSTPRSVATAHQAEEDDRVEGGDPGVDAAQARRGHEGDRGTA
jgi:RNA-directed DNA polymerase